MSVVLTIDSTDRSDQINWTSVIRDNRINSEPDELRFSLLYGGTKTYRPTINDEVVLTVNSVKQFGGRIVRIQDKALSPELLQYDIICKDYTQDLDGELVTEKYESQTIQDIIEDIIDNYTSGFTYTGVVASDIDVDSVTFNRLTITQCLEKLSELTGYSWYVDYNKDVHFFARAENPAPFRVTNDESHADYGKIIYKSLQKRDDISQLRNTILVEGGEKVGLSRTITRDGGEVSDEGTLNLEYKFSEKPVVEVNSVAQTVGVDFLDDDGSFDVMWSFGQKYLRFTTGNIPTGGDVIEITGTPLYPIVVNVPDPVSIGLYGKKEYVIKDDTIRSDDEALERALAELRAYSNSIIDGSFETYTDGLEAGQIITISDTLRGIAEQVLIQSVRMKFTDPNGDKQAYSVKFATLKTIGIISFLQKQIRDEEILEDEVETLLSFLQLEDEASFTDSLGTPTQNSAPFYYADATVNGNEGKWNFSTWS